ncbi:hypothetical protein NQ315_008788 [Exocentrus adspersus]|uniref:Regulatory protein zeste n=1 Tax=Exocentrus adspersus TaxID=1586481 RepID=A0AAV8VGY7_9CUCU|nr:hypothetical protein NQ315_008788 [Exocentrus adspersus]
MEEDQMLRRGKFSAEFSFKDAQIRWEKITNHLNSIPGARKNWKDWRRTWQDLKKNVKKKNTFIKQSSQVTGGGPPTCVTFTDDDNILLKILDGTTLTGDESVNESTVIIDDTKIVFDHDDFKENEENAGAEEYAEGAEQHAEGAEQMQEELLC